MAQYGHGLVFVDEAGMDDHINGWAPLGQACVRRTSFLRDQKYSIIPALSFDRILALDIFEGVCELRALCRLSSWSSCMFVFHIVNYFVHPLVPNRPI